MADDIDDEDVDADQPPMVPAFLATMTDEERKTFVARFNGARMVCADPLTIRLPTDDELAPFVKELQSLPGHDN